MIVYNVERRWFPMKNDAESYRRSLKLPPDATFKLQIETREELAAFLEGLCNVARPGAVSVATGIPEEVVERNRLPDDYPPSYVPQFLVREWRKRRGL